MSEIPEDPFAPDPLINNDLGDRYDGGPAYPVPIGTQQNRYACAVGMSLRDWFAGQAIGTMIYKCENSDGGWDMHAVASCCYALADIMIEARGIK